MEDVAAKALTETGAQVNATDGAGSEAHPAEGGDPVAPIRSDQK